MSNSAKGNPADIRPILSVLADLTDEADVQVERRRGDLPPTLDVRRNSIFDAAAATAEVLTLDEHFRSVAQLFTFVGDRLYDGAVSVAVRTPDTDTLGRIGVVTVEGTRDDQGVVTAEVDWIIKRVRTLARHGRRGIGLISPFRVQADALEQAALAAFSGAQIDDMELRVGTVHDFQGTELGMIIVSLGIDPDSPPQTWQFAGDPHLFAVMATRARQRIEWVLSATPPPGLLAE